MTSVLKKSMTGRWALLAPLTLLSLLLVSAVASAAMTPSPSTLDFGNVDRYQWTPGQQVTFKNEGEDPVEVYEVSTTGSDFSLNWSGCGNGTYWNGNGCSLEVRVSPSQYGNVTGTLRLETSDGDVDVPLSANVLRGAVTPSPSSVSFSPAPWYWGSQFQSLYLQANEYSLDIGSVSITGPDAALFAISGDGCGNTALHAYNGCNIGVTFNPTGPKENAQATLEVAGTATNAPLSIPLSATALVGPVADVTPGGHDFGAVQVGKSAAARTFTVANVGDAPLQIQRVLVVGSSAKTFQAGSDQCYLVEVQPGSNCTFKISFSPSRAGEMSGSVFIITNTPGGVQTIDISGRALPPLGAVARLTGTPRVGEEMRCKAVDVVGEPSYSWLRDDETVTGAEEDRYRLTEADAGARIACRVTVTSQLGSKAVTSPKSATVAPRDLAFQSQGRLAADSCRVVRLPALAGVRVDGADPVTALSPLALRSTEPFELEIGGIVRSGEKIVLPPRALSALPDGASPVVLNGDAVGDAILAPCRLAAEMFGSKRQGASIEIASAEALGKVVVQVPRLRFKATKGLNGQIEIISGADANPTVLPIAGRSSARNGVEVRLSKHGVSVAGLPEETGSVSVSLDPHTVKAPIRSRASSRSIVPGMKVDAAMRQGGKLSTIGRVLWRR